MPIVRMSLPSSYSGARPSRAETREDALCHLDEIFDDCIQSMLDSDVEIPEPVAWTADIGYVPEEGVVELGVASKHSVTFTDPGEADPWTSVGVEDDDR